MSVARAQREIDSAEFTEWIAFHQLEPWGTEIEDMRTATIDALLRNINRRPGSKLVQVRDVMPVWGESQKKPDREAAAQKAEAYFRALYKQQNSGGKK